MLRNTPIVKYLSGDGTHLDLSNKDITDEDIIEIITPYLLSQPNIASVDLSINDIQKKGAESLASINTVTKLDLSYNYEISVEGIAAFTKNNTLLSLNLSGCKLNKNAAEIFSEITSLLELDLSRNNMGDNGARLLSNNSKLLSLNLTSNSITEIGAIELSKNDNLKYLCLNFNPIGDIGAKALATNTTITILDVYECRLSAEGCKALASNKILEELNIGNNFIGEDTSKIAASNPNLKIYTDGGLNKNDAVLEETDPLKRANYGREAGVPTEVPSLKRLAMFALKESKADTSKLPGELKDEINKPKI